MRVLGEGYIRCASVQDEACRRGAVCVYERERERERVCVCVCVCVCWCVRLLTMQPQKPCRVHVWAHLDNAAQLVAHAAQVQQQARTHALAAQQQQGQSAAIARQPQSTAITSAQASKIHIISSLPFFKIAPKSSFEICVCSQHLGAVSRIQNNEFKPNFIYFTGPRPFERTSPAGH